MIKRTVAALLFTVLLTGCAKWKVNELQKNILFQIKSGTSPGTLDFAPDENGIVDISFDIRISNNQVLCSDNSQHRFQIFNLEGQPELSIGTSGEGSSPVEKDNEEGVDEGEQAGGEDEQTGSEVDENVVQAPAKQVDFSFGIIGSFVADSEGRVYIENTILPVDDDNKRNSRNEGVDMSPSYILVFDREGKILYSLGKDGSTEVPFHSIYNMFSDNKSRLFVITKSSENWSVFRYDGKNRDFDTHFDTTSFSDERDGKVYRGLVENIIAFNSGNKLLVSVAYYDETRFKYRKIFEYYISENKPGKSVLELPDPKNELFSILEDKYIILWDYEKRDLRFSIWNLQENIINNLRINLSRVRPYYEKVLVDETGRLYTMIVNEDAIEIKEWK